MRERALASALREHRTQSQSEFVFTSCDMNAAPPLPPPRPVGFADGADVPARADLPETTRARYGAAIVGYLRYEQRPSGA